MHALDCFATLAMTDKMDCRVALAMTSELIATIYGENYLEVTPLSMHYLIIKK